MSRLHQKINKNKKSLLVPGRLSLTAVTNTVCIVCIQKLCIKRDGGSRLLPGCKDCCWCEKLKFINLTLLNSSLVAVEKRVQSGTIIHHKHSSSWSFGWHAPFPLDVQRHLRQTAVNLSDSCTAAPPAWLCQLKCWLTGLVWTVDRSSNLTVAEVITLMMSSHIWPASGTVILLQLICTWVIVN